MTATHEGHQARGWTEVDRSLPMPPDQVGDPAIVRSEAAVDPRDGGELWDLEAQLIARFSPPLRPEAVQRCLCDVVARYDAARVRTYVAVLIERRATERLRAAAADAGRSSTRQRATELKPRQPAVRRLVASDEDC